MQQPYGSTTTVEVRTVSNYVIWNYLADEIGAAYRSRIKLVIDCATAQLQLFRPLYSNDLARLLFHQPTRPWRAT